MIMYPNHLMVWPLGLRQDKLELRKENPIYAEIGYKRYIYTAGGKSFSEHDFAIGGKSL